MADRRRQDMASAIKTMARLLGHVPADIPLDLRALNARLKHLSPLAAGISTARWHNVRSLLRAALALAGPLMRGRTTEPLSGAWEVLQGRIRVHSDRIKLSRLLRWLSGQNLTPERVTEADLAGFHQSLAEEALIRDAQATWAEMARAWNRAVDEIEGWPQVKIDRPLRRQSYVLPWSAFPPSLKQDVDAWIARLAGKDFADDGPMRPLTEGSLAAREYHLRAFASALVLRGRDPQSLISLAACVTLENFIEGLRFFYERFGNKPSPTTSNLASMLKSVAKHWLGVDEDIQRRMREISRKLTFEYHGLTDKNQKRLLPFQDMKNCQTLLALPLKLRAEIERDKLPPHRRRVLGQVAVALEILLMAPMRAKNLAGLEVGRHIISAGRKLMLTIPAREVKNGVDLSFELPEESANLMRWYLKEIRVAEPGCTALFPTAACRPKDKDTLAVQINETVHHYTGFTVNPHLFRHIGALIYLTLNPGGYEVMRRVLGHKSMDTTSRFYAGLETVGAAKHFDEQILKLRARLPATTGPQRVQHSKKKGRKKP
jgi:integrase